LSYVKEFIPHKHKPMVETPTEGEPKVSTIPKICNMAVFTLTITYISQY
jgi:hypothetical protein